MKKGKFEGLLFVCKQRERERQIGKMEKGADCSRADQRKTEN